MLNLLSQDGVLHLLMKPHLFVVVVSGSHLRFVVMVMAVLMSFLVVMLNGMVQYVILLAIVVNHTLVEIVSVMADNAEVGVPMIRMMAFVVGVEVEVFSVIFVHVVDRPFNLGGELVSVLSQFLISVSLLSTGVLVSITLRAVGPSKSLVRAHLMLLEVNSCHIGHTDNVDG